MPFVPDVHLRNHGVVSAVPSKDSKEAAVQYQHIKVPGDGNCPFYSVAMGFMEVVISDEKYGLSKAKQSELFEKIKTLNPDLKALAAADQPQKVRDELLSLLELTSADDFFNHLKHSNLHNEADAQFILAAYVYVLGYAFKEICKKICKEKPEADKLKAGEFGSTDNVHDLAYWLGCNAKIYSADLDSCNSTKSLQQYSTLPEHPGFAIRYNVKINHFDFLAANEKNSFVSRLPKANSDEKLRSNPKPANTDKQFITSFIENVSIKEIKAEKKERKHIYANTLFAVTADQQEKLDALLAQEISKRQSTESIQSIIDKFNAQIAAELSTKPKVG